MYNRVPCAMTIVANAAVDTATARGSSNLAYGLDRAPPENHGPDDPGTPMNGMNGEFEDPCGVVLNDMGPALNISCHTTDAPGSATKRLL